MEEGSGSNTGWLRAAIGELRESPLRAGAAVLAILAALVAAAGWMFGLPGGDDGGRRPPGPTGPTDVVGPPDRDGDGVPDPEDACPGEATTVDADGNGCEDEAAEDSDGDGVPDTDDKCLDEAADPDANGDGCPDGPAGYDGLQELVEAEDAPSEPEYGSVELAGDTFDDGAMITAYPDEKSEISLRVGARYTKVTGYVGIDNQANCEDNRAEVSVTDPKGNALWGPETVNFDSKQEVSARITGQNRVILKQRPLQSGYDECDSGGAPVAWGQMRFAPASLEAQEGE